MIKDHKKCHTYHYFKILKIQPIKTLQILLKLCNNYYVTILNVLSQISESFLHFYFHIFFFLANFNANMYTNVPLKEAIDIALRKLYEQDEPPSIARKTMKRLLNMAVSQNHFKCNETWYVQKDGLAMGASRAVILANFWLEQYETALSRDIPEIFLPEKDLHGICPECNKKVTYRSKCVECECCLNWYHVKCVDISDDEYRNISETVW